MQARDGRRCRQHAALDEPRAELQRGSRRELLDPADAEAQQLPHRRLAAGRGGGGRQRDGGWGKADAVADRGGDEAEQHGMAGDQFIVRPVGGSRLRRAASVREDAERSGCGRRLAAVAGLVEQEAGEDLVAVQRRQRLMRPAEEADEVSRVERRRRRYRAQVGVDLLDEVVGQRRQRDLQPADPPRRLQPPRRRPRIQS